MPSIERPVGAADAVPVQGPAHHVQAGDARSEGAAWTGEQLRRRALLDDVALLDHQDPVGEQERVEHVVGHDDRGTIGQHLAQHLAYGGRDGDVERGHRLVEEQQAWVRREGTGDRDPLRLSSGELRGLAVGVRRGIDLAQPVLCDGARLAACLTEAAWPEGDVVERGQVREQQRLLGEQCDSTSVWRDPDLRLPGSPDVEEHATVERRGAGVRSQQTGDHRHGGGLAGTVRPEHGERLPDAHVHGQVEAALAHRGVELEAHVAPRTRASPITTIATTTSSSDSATAASASVSRCR